MYLHIGEVISGDLAVALPLSVSMNTIIDAVVDHFTKFVCVKLLYGKKQTASYIQEFCASVKRQTGWDAKALRTDNGGEFSSGELATFC